MAGTQRCRACPLLAERCSADHHHPRGINTPYFPAPCAVEFSPTVSIFFLEDLVPFADDPSTNQCIEMVKRASSFNSRRLNMM